VDLMKRLLLLVMLAGCGRSASLSTPPPDGSTPDARYPICPATVPTAGAACSASAQFVSCQYPGEGPNHICGPRAECGPDQSSHKFQWKITPPASDCGTAPRPCPSSMGELAEGAPCPAGLGTNQCDYDTGRCACLSCLPADGGAGFGLMWSCRAWVDPDPGCPDIAPLVGTACDMPEQICFYAGCGKVPVGDNLACHEGSWRGSGIAGSCIIPQCP
jgi:hypothetical protein